MLRNDQCIGMSIAEAVTVVTVGLTDVEMILMMTMTIRERAF